MKWDNRTQLWGLLLGSVPEVNSAIMQQFNSTVYGIHQAKNVEGAGKLIEENHYDYVLCFQSFLMDSGGDFVRLITREPYHKKVIVILDKGTRFKNTNKYTAVVWGFFCFHSDIGISLNTDLGFLQLLVEQALNHSISAGR